LDRTRGRSNAKLVWTLMKERMSNMPSSRPNAFSFSRTRLSFLHTYFKWQQKLLRAVFLYGDLTTMESLKISPTS